MDQLPKYYFQPLLLRLIEPWAPNTSIIALSRMRGTDATDRQSIHMCSKQSHLQFISRKIEERKLASVWSMVTLKGIALHALATCVFFSIRLSSSSTSIEVMERPRPWEPVCFLVLDD